MKKNTVKKPVILIAGYLGSGKTTFLNELLRQEKRKISLIVNDMGSINVDASILKKQGSDVAQAEMFEMQNGCICCTLRDEFIKQMEKISKKSNTEAVFVEASGISDPGAIAASFLAYEEDNPKTNVYLSSIITVVDGDRIYREFLKDLKDFTEESYDDEAQSITTLIVDQMEFCNRIVLNKCDLLDKEQIEQVKSVIRDFQTKAPIIESVNGKVDPDEVLTTEKFDFSQVDSSSAIQRAVNSINQDVKTPLQEFGIQSFVYEEKRPFNREKFMNFIKKAYPKELIRAKGYIWFADADTDVQLFEQAGRNSSVCEISYWVDAYVEEEKQRMLEEDEELRNSWDETYGDRLNQIVFIGKKYDEEAIRKHLVECLEDKVLA